MLPLNYADSFLTQTHTRRQNQLAGLILIGLRITQDRVIAVIGQGLLHCLTC